MQNFDEAREYFEDETLRERLIEISTAVYELNADDIGYVFAYPDDLKFRSCMTLFALITPEDSIFRKNLDKYYAQVISPIVSEGDTIGSVVLMATDAASQMGETEVKLAQSAAGFLGKQMEQ